VKIDNSMMSAFFVCPWYYFEKYEAKIERIRKTDALSFGKRMHKLLEARLREIQTTVIVEDGQKMSELDVVDEAINDPGSDLVDWDVTP
jgi:ATP-dependent helicase/DNAse subunit B